MKDGETVAFIGLGQMGAPMARNLVSAGFMVRVWNRTAVRAREVEGAVASPSPKAAAEGALMAITMLADDAAVEFVTFGSEGLLAGLATDGLHVGMSTISVALSRRLAESHASTRRRFMAAPVFGRPDAAAAARLWIVPGGSEEDLRQAERVFGALGQGTFPMPTAPLASLAKLLGNFLIGATVEALGEALTVAEKGGLDPERLLAMLTGTIFGSPIVNGYGARIARTEFLPAGFALPLGLKDVNLALAAASELQAPLPLGAMVRDRLVTALERGRGHYDWGGFASVIREAAGLPARRPV
jgi:3-hydroxyisobutyrate dehydrogenase-like beta-hydroxyacid dehydrogenase